MISSLVNSLSGTRLFRTYWLGIASSPSHHDRAFATASLYQAACVGIESAIETLLLIAIDDTDSVQMAALQTLCEASPTAHPNVIGVLCWLLGTRPTSIASALLLRSARSQRATAQMLSLPLEAIAEDGSAPSRPYDSPRKHSAGRVDH